MTPDPRQHEQRRGTRAARATTVAAVAACAAIVVLTGRGDRPGDHAPGPPPRVLTSIAPPPAARVMPAAPAAAASAARTFASDYAQTLAGRRAAAGVRHATAGLRRRIAAAGVRVPRREDRASGTSVHLLLRPVKPGVAAAAGSVRVGRHVARLRFLIVRVGRDWVVDAIADPDDTAPA